MIDGDKEDKFCTRDGSDCTDVGGIMDELEVHMYNEIDNSSFLRQFFFLN